MENVAQFPPPAVADAPANERYADVIDLIKEVLEEARAGKFRSVTFVGVNPEGTAIGTRWSCADADLTMLIGHLAVLQHDMMATRT